MASVTPFIKSSKNEMTNVRFSVSQGRNKPKLYYTSEIKINAKLWNKKEQGISSRITFNTQKRIEINTAIFERKI
jgi:hypothetical protein